MNRPKAKEQLRRDEGERLRPYVCPAGHRTIGVGWNLDAHAPPEDIAACLHIYGTITEKMSDRLLDISLDAAIRQCRDVFADFDDFSENRQLAIVNIVFNLGLGGFLKFKKTVAAIRAQDWERAAAELTDSLWFKQVGDRAKRIIQATREG